MGLEERAKTRAKTTLFALHERYRAKNVALDYAYIKLHNTYTICIQGGDYMRRYKRKRKKRAYRRRKSNDTHHLFFIRRTWSNGPTKALRDHYYARASIPRDTLHKAIHGEIAYVPVPRKVSVVFALKQLQTLEDYHAIDADDSLEKKLMVFIAIFDCLEEPTTQALRKQLEIVQCYKKPP